MSSRIEEANRQALERVLKARPVLKTIGIARDVIPGMDENTLLHAGPPITWDRMSGPVRGAVIGALLLEGRASTPEEAAELAASGEIRFDPCHHHQAVGPMAGLISPSMSVYVVENETYGNRAYATLNEGYGKVLRYGAYDEEVLTRLRWLADTMAPVLKAAIEAVGGIDIKAMAAQAIHMGDEGHNRNKAGSALFLRALAGAVVRTAPNAEKAAEVLEFMAGNELTFLNPLMAACKATMDAAHGIEGSTMVTTMARNGTEFGIRVSGLGDRWFTGPSAVPDGLYFPGFGPEHANPDVGDSTITETAGIGGFAMAAAPAIVQFIGGSPEMAMEATQEMYEITLGENEAFGIPHLNFRGTPTGIDIRKVVETGIVPRVNTGIAHKEAGIGQIGAGLVQPPMEAFVKAVEAMAEALA